jgi:predicted unusual protein kinase regulating ubiquinone biosynthesis (AarF/ABC1/UbiB family)
MALARIPGHWKRYKDIAWLLVKHGRSDLVRDLDWGGEPLPDAPAAPNAQADAEELARDLEKLGPTFIKLGQVLSSRGDLLPPAYIAALSRLQDQVEPFSFAEVERIVEGELGVRISKAFEQFEFTPIAAASLGQVHRARLRDGREVAVKVQRPGIREAVLEDLEAFKEIAGFLDEHSDAGARWELGKTVAQFGRTLLAELDYRQEASNLEAIGLQMREFPRIVVPAPIADYTTSRVLTMEYVPGQKVTSVPKVRLVELDTEALAEELFRAYLTSILIHGIFHADPHAGNVFLTDDGRLALLDLGMVGRISPTLQDGLLKVLIDVSEGRGDRAAERAAEIGERLEGFDAFDLERRVSELVGIFRESTLSRMQIGRVLLDVARAARETGLRLPPELTVLGKTLLQLDEAGRTLAPDFDPNASIRSNATDLLRRRMLQSASPGNLATALLEAKEFAEKLPSRVNRVLDGLANNQLRFRVDTIDETVLIEGLQKIANRIAMGLVLAALIVGAALLMQVPTTFRIFGYPGLAMLFFLAAGAGGVALIASILKTDRTAKSK